MPQFRYELNDFAKTNGDLPRLALTPQQIHNELWRKVCDRYCLTPQQASDLDDDTLARLATECGEGHWAAPAAAQIRPFMSSFIENPDV